MESSIPICCKSFDARLFFVEKIFGYISNVTLVELSDINNPLLRKLSEECPGTFQHSMAVSNLASDAARRIGANELLIRAGALYHDIGKIDNPAFIIYNTLYITIQKGETNENKGFKLYITVSG